MNNLLYALMDVAPEPYYYDYPSAGGSLLGIGIGVVIALIIIAVVAIVAIAAVIVIIVVCVKKSKKKKALEATGSAPAQEENVAAKADEEVKENE